MATPYTLRAYESLLARNRHTWRSGLSFAVLGPLLSLAAMGFGVGSLVAERSPAALGGVPYAEFLAPGMLAAAAMQTGVAESTWPVLGAVKWDRYYFAMLASPLSVPHVFYGHLLWITTRLAVVSAAFVVAALLLGMDLTWRVAGMLPAAVLTGTAFAAPTAAWAIGRKSEMWFATQYRVLIMPLFLFSATFFPLESLPAALRVAVQVFPLWHGVELCRGLAFGALSGGAAALHTAYLVTLTAAGVLAGRRTFAKALAR